MTDHPERHRVHEEERMDFWRAGRVDPSRREEHLEIQKLHTLERPPDAETSRRALAGKSTGLSCFRSAEDRTTHKGTVPQRNQVGKPRMRQTEP